MHVCMNEKKLNKCERSYFRSEDNSENNLKMKKYHLKLTENAVKSHTIYKSNVYLTGKKLSCLGNSKK